ncbi:MAG: DUF960 domain-containing protein [Lachnospiraceae bacterium]|nr:DUF960 domain-containing protein [Lachnospiraceae bacterium]
MFQNQRYVTRGVSSEIPFWIQMVLWVMIDAMEEPKDWLQVFRLKGEGETLHIIHTQEEPVYCHEVTLPLNDEKEFTAKIFVIDDTDHSTMLLAEEY